MAGFAFRYRASGEAPTIESFGFKTTGTLSEGDMLNLEDGEVDLGATGDGALIGAAAQTLSGEASTTSIRVIVDGDAVYAVMDNSVRLKGAALDLQGLTGVQGIAAAVNAEFVVDVDSAADEETLVRINGDRHYDKAPEPVPEEHLFGGELNAVIARATVRYHALQRGRGPTRAKAFHHDNILVVILEGVMTKAERSLAAAGKTDAVLLTREEFQDLLRPYLRSTIERLTGGKVLAFMSANHLDPDLAAELFVLDRPISAGPPQPD